MAGPDALPVHLAPHLCPRRAALQALCQAAGDVIDAALAAAASRDPEDDPPLEAVAALYSDKTAGGWTTSCGAAEPVLIACVVGGEG